MYDVSVGKRVGFLTLAELVYWAGGTGRKYQGYRCVCDCGAELRVRSEDLRHGKQLYCSRQCDMRYPRTLAEWLENTKRSGDCMEWQGPLTNGYGRIVVRGTIVHAHREVLRLSTGEDPEAVMHTCDNPPCINPKHLRSGTNRENTRDMVTKQRHAHGEKVHTAKLTVVDIRAIRKARAAGEYGTTLAKKYGVGHGTIYAICNNQTWKQV